MKTIWWINKLVGQLLYVVVTKALGIEVRSKSLDIRHVRPVCREPVGWHMGLCVSPNSAPVRCRIPLWSNAPRSKYIWLITSDYINQLRTKTSCPSNKIAVLLWRCLLLPSLDLTRAISWLCLWITACSDLCPLTKLSDLCQPWPQICTITLLFSNSGTSIWKNNLQAISSCQ